MNKELNKRGRGRAPKKGRPDLGRETYIQEIIEKAESEASSRVAVKLGAIRVKSEGQSVEQPVLTAAFFDDSTQQVPLIVEETSSSRADSENIALVITEEEVASKASTESDYSSKEKGNAAEGSSHQTTREGNKEIFTSPRDWGSATKEARVLVAKNPQPLSVELVEIPSDYCKIFMAPTNSTIDFPIGDLGTSVPTKPIPLAALPTFLGLISEDPDTFLFEFDIVCRGYDYTTDAQKLKIFPATLKGMALRWFMGLGGKSISTWEDMHTAFQEKFQDYCKSQNIKEELFKFTQKEDESLEDYVERFNYTLQCLGHSDLDKEILKIVLLQSL